MSAPPPRNPPSPLHRPSPPRLRTQRLELIACDAELAAADARYDHAELGRQLAAGVPHEWPPETTRDVLAFFADQMRAHPDQTGWWEWFIVRDEGPAAQRVLVGGAGFKGPPTPDGMVEIGYAVLPSFQRRGYATEAARALVGHALAQPGITRVEAETFPDHAASRRVLERNGMQTCGPGQEPGTIRYRIAPPSPSA